MIYKYYYDTNSKQLLIEPLFQISKGSIEVTKEQYNHLVSEQSDGKAIVLIEGSPSSVDAAPSSYHNWNGKEWTITEENQKLINKELKAEKLIQLENDLKNIELKISRFERIKERTRSEEKELKMLIEDSTNIFREMKSLE